MTSEDEPQKSSTGLSTAVAVGLSLGVALGLLVFDNLGLGMAVGLVMGIALYGGTASVRKKSDDTDADGA
jgi:hypothetical protein